MALEEGGVAVLTVDLRRGTRQLWDKCLGQQVEPPGEHGTVDDLVGEAAAERLQLDAIARCPLSTASIDVLGLVLRKGA